ncbi:MAG: hypothetical protein JWO13_2290 [Acidobacteriales bacterium]|nr:hypothetical protein [Terriglobales bacterium]
MKQSLQRREDWPEKLAEHFEAKPKFKWGVSDCATSVCDAIRAMTDVDVAADFRGKYSSGLGAMKVMKKFANGGVEETAEKITAEHGMQEIPIVFAGRGDVVLYDDEAMGPALGNVSLNGVTAVFVSPKGTSFIPVNKCRRAWRV